MDPGPERNETGILKKQKESSFCQNFNKIEEKGIIVSEERFDLWIFLA